MKQFENVGMVKVHHDLILSRRTVRVQMADPNFLDGNVAAFERSTAHSSESSLAQIPTDGEITRLGWTAAHFHLVKLSGVTSCMTVAYHVLSRVICFLKFFNLLIQETSGGKRIIEEYFSRRLNRLKLIKSIGLNY